MAKNKYSIVPDHAPVNDMAFLTQAQKVISEVMRDQDPFYGENRTASKKDEQINAICMCLWLILEYLTTREPTGAPVTKTLAENEAKFAAMVKDMLE